MDDGAVFEGYSYRTSSRFGSRVRVSIGEGKVAVTGPRVGVLTYRLWIVAQVIIFWLIVPALLGAAVLWDWRYLVLALGLLVLHWAVGTFGAVAFWELANLNAFTAGTTGTTIEFPLGAISEVRIGRGWARKGLWLVIPPYVPGLNQMAEGYCVSFEAPGGESGRSVVYALHMQSEEIAQSLAGLLMEQESTG